MSMTAPIDFHCPECGARLRARPELAGVKGLCARCGADVRIPGPPRVSPRTFRTVNAVLGALNTLLMAVLIVGATARLDRFRLAGHDQPAGTRAMLFCIPLTLGWLMAGAGLAWLVERRKFAAGLVLMAHTALSSFYVLAIALQPEAPMGAYARVMAILAATAGLTAAYVVGVESGRRLTRHEPARGHRT
jgi:hypothetical protein